MSLVVRDQVGGRATGLLQGECHPTWADAPAKGLLDVLTQLWVWSMQLREGPGEVLSEHQQVCVGGPELVFLERQELEGGVQDFGRAQQRVQVRGRKPGQIPLGLALLEGEVEIVLEMLDECVQPLEQEGVHRFSVWCVLVVQPEM